MAQYDVYHIEERLKEWHPEFVRLDWDEDRLLHKVVMRDARGTEYSAMHVPFGQLDARVIYRMQEIDPERGYNPFEEIDRELRRKERAETYKIEEISRDMAEVLHRPLVEDYFY